MLKVFPAFDYQLNRITILRETQLSCADILGNLLLREGYIFLNFPLGKQKLFLTKKLLEMSQDGNQQVSWRRLGFLPENRLYWSMLT